MTTSLTTLSEYEISHRSTETSVLCMSNNSHRSRHLSQPQQAHEDRVLGTHIEFLRRVILAGRALLGLSQPKGPRFSVEGTHATLLNFNRTTRNLILIQTDLVSYAIALCRSGYALAQTLAHELACSRSTTGIRS